MINFWNIVKNYAEELAIYAHQKEHEAAKRKVEILEKTAEQAAEIARKNTVKAEYWKSKYSIK